MVAKPNEGGVNRCRYPALHDARRRQNGRVSGNDPVDGVEHVWTHDDRVAQLADMESLCQRMVELFAAHQDPRAADLMADRASMAGRLLREGFTQADLNALGGQFPDGAWLAESESPRL